MKKAFQVKEYHSLTGEVLRRAGDHFLASIINLQKDMAKKPSLEYRQRKRQELDNTIRQAELIAIECYRRGIEIDPSGNRPVGHP